MHVDTSEPKPRTSSGPATRARILAVATEQFCSHGIRATSADRIIDGVGITKVTFYRHSRAKSDLVVAHLEDQAAAEREWMRSARHAGDAAGSLLARRIARRGFQLDRLARILTRPYRWRRRWPTMSRRPPEENR